MNLQIYQVGVVSYGLGCANPRWPALYTRVTKVCQHFNYGIIDKKYFFYYINDGFPRVALRLKKRENFRNLGLILPFFCHFVAISPKKKWKISPIFPSSVESFH